MSAIDAAPRRSRAPWLRAFASVLLLAGLVAWVGPSSLLGVLEALSIPWLLFALVLSVPQVLLSAWRWQFTTGLLGMPLPFAHALREYCLGNVLNQVLPGGVAGDLTRAWRHARTASATRAAWHAVMIERAAGQLVLLACALVALPWAPSIGGEFRNGLGQGLTLGMSGIVLALFAAAVFFAGRMLPAVAWFGRDFGQAVFSRRAWFPQLLLSLALVGSYVVVYLCCARALGVGTGALVLVPLILCVLVAMAVPLSLAGWGIREGAAAGIWMLADLPVAQGVAISLLYGVVVLVSALAGAFLLLACPSPPVAPVDVASDSPG